MGMCNTTVPLEVVNNSTLFSSPAESTLTPIHFPPPSSLPPISALVGSPDDVDFGGDEDFFDTGNGILAYNATLFSPHAQKTFT